MNPVDQLPPPQPPVALVKPPDQPAVPQGQPAAALAVTQTPEQAEAARRAAELEAKDRAARDAAHKETEAQISAVQADVATSATGPARKAEQEALRARYIREVKVNFERLFDEQNSDFSTPDVRNDVKSLFASFIEQNQGTPGAPELLQAWAIEVKGALLDEISKADEKWWRGGGDVEHTEAQSLPSKLRTRVGTLSDWIQKDPTRQASQEIWEKKEAAAQQEAQRKIDELTAQKAQVEPAVRNVRTEYAKLDAAYKPNGLEQKITDLEASLNGPLNSAEVLKKAQEVSVIITTLAAIKGLAEDRNVRDHKQPERDQLLGHLKEGKDGSGKPATPHDIEEAFKLLKSQAALATQTEDPSEKGFVDGIPDLIDSIPLIPDDFKAKLKDMIKPIEKFIASFFMNPKYEKYAPYFMGSVLGYGTLAAMGYEPAKLAVKARDELNTLGLKGAERTDLLKMPVAKAIASLTAKIGDSGYKGDKDVLDAVRKRLQPLDPKATVADALGKTAASSTPPPPPAEPPKPSEASGKTAVAAGVVGGGTAAVASAEKTPTVPAPTAQTPAGPSRPAEAPHTGPGANPTEAYTAAVNKELQKHNGQPPIDVRTKPFVFSLPYFEGSQLKGAQVSILGDRLTIATASGTPAHFAAKLPGGAHMESVQVTGLLADGSATITGGRFGFSDSGTVELPKLLAGLEKMRTSPKESLKFALEGGKEVEFIPVT